jgi:hypothetical protein
MGYAGGGSGGLDEAAVTALIASGSVIKKGSYRAIVNTEGATTIGTVEFAAGELAHEDKILIFGVANVTGYFTGWRVAGYYIGDHDYPSVMQLTAQLFSTGSAARLVMTSEGTGYPNTLYSGASFAQDITAAWSMPLGVSVDNYGGGVNGPVDFTVFIVKGTP